MKKTTSIRILTVLIILTFLITGCSGEKGKAESGFDINSNGAKIVLDSSYDFDKKVDALSYEMKLELDTETDSLNEDVTISVKNNTGKDVEELFIRDMTPAIHEFIKKELGDAEENANKTSEVLSVSYNDAQIEPEYSEDKSTIKISLSEPLADGEEGKIGIVMRTDIPERNDRFGVMKLKDGNIYALSFCFPYLADNVNGEWILDPFFDDGESRSFDMADYNVELKTPENLTVVATGLSTTENGTTKITAENYRDFAIVASELFKVDSFDVGGVKVNSYYLDSDHSDEYRNISKLVAIDSINLFEENVGEYPYEELDMVACTFGFAFGGMEYPGLIMNNASSYYEGTLKDAWGLSAVVSHEIAHQWFYSVVGNREYTDGWLDEAFATYLENMYAMNDGESNKYIREVDEIYPKAEDFKALVEESIDYSNTEYKNKVYINVSPYDYGEEDSYGEREYTVGYLFLEELKKTMGEEKFDQFIKEYYKEYYFKVATTESVLKLIESIDSSDAVKTLIGGYFKQ